MHEIHVRIRVANPIRIRVGVQVVISGRQKNSSLGNDNSDFEYIKCILGCLSNLFSAFGMIPDNSIHFAY